MFFIFQLIICSVIIHRYSNAEIIIASESIPDESISIKNDKPFLKTYNVEDPILLTAFPINDFHSFCKPVLQSSQTNIIARGMFDIKYEFVPMFAYNEPYLYLIDKKMFLLIFKVTANFERNQYALEKISEFNTNLTTQEDFTIFSMSINNQHKLFVTLNKYLLIFDISNPTDAKKLYAESIIPDVTYAVAIKDSFVFIGNYSNKVQIYDSGDGTSMHLVKILNVDTEFDNDDILLQDLFIDGEKNLLYILDNLYGIIAYDISSISNPRIINTNFKEGGGLNFEILGQNMIMTKVESNTSETLNLFEYDIEYSYDQSLITKITFTKLRDNGKYPNLITWYLTPKYAVLLFQNVYHYYKTGIPQSTVPHFEDIKKELTELDVFPIFIEINKNTSSGYTEYIPDYIVLHLTDSGYSMAFMKPNPLTLYCNGTDNLNEGSYKYAITQITKTCEKKKNMSPLKNTNGVCLINNTLSIDVSREIPGKLAFIIGLSVGLSITVIILILCIIYYKKTQKYQKLYNELSQKNENYTSKLEMGEYQSKDLRTKNSRSSGVKVDDIKLEENS